MATTDRRSSLASETTLGIKAPCLVATTANIALSGIQTIDGVSVGSNSERVLVKNQTDQTQNGIYLASSGNWTLAPDAQGNTDWTLGTILLITGGGVNAGSIFEQTCPDSPVVIGTSLVAFAAVAALSGVAGLTTRIATATPVVPVNTDRIIFVDTVTIAAPVAVPLPAAAGRTALQPLTIKDSTGGAASTNITITPNGSEKIDGLSSVKIASNYGWITIKPLATGGWALL